MLKLYKIYVSMKNLCINNYSCNNILVSELTPMKFLINLFSNVFPSISNILHRYNTAGHSNCHTRTERSDQRQNRMKGRDMQIISISALFRRRRKEK